jgi:hypothetical protein
MIKSAIVTPSIVPREDIPTFKPRELFTFRVEHFSPLLAAICGLTSKYSLPDIDRINSGEDQDHQSQYLAMVAAHDIILRATTTYPNHFQLMMSEQLVIQDVTKAFQELLSAWRISTHQTSGFNNLCREIKKNMLEGVSIGPFDMTLCNCDNIGFTVKGRQASYNQYTVIQDCLVRRLRLMGIGIYTPKNVSTQLSREPTHDWRQSAINSTMTIEEDETDETALATEVVGVKSSDIELLSNCVLEGIQLAIDMVVDGLIRVNEHVPRAGHVVCHRSRCALQKGNIDVESDVVDGEPVDSEGSSSSETDNTTNETTDTAALASAAANDAMAVEGEEENESGADAPPANAFYGPDTKLNAINKDLANKTTVCALLYYIWSTREMIIKKWYDQYKVQHDGQPPPTDMPLSELPPSTIGAFIMCDGQPAAQIASIVALDNQRYYSGIKDVDFPDDCFPNNTEKDSEFDKWFHAINSLSPGLLGREHSNGKTGSRFYGKIYAFPGAFHTCLKFHNCCGLLFGNFLKHFFRAWRNTSNKIDWILYPRDPRQLESELPYYILAHYRSAFTYLWQTKGSSKDDIPSAADVNAYMLERAESCPFRQAVILHLRYAEISKMMRMSYKLDERGCVDLFMAAIRLAVTIWVSSHATDYVRLACDLLQLWHCAPDAMRKLYAKEIFTRLNANGNPIATDLAQEETVKHIRGYLGKVWRPYHAAMMEVYCNIIPSRSSSEHVNQELRTGTRKQRPSRSKGTEVLRASSPLIKCYDLIHTQMQFWHPANEPIIGWNNDKPIYTEAKSLALPGDETLNEKVLLFYTYGSQRVIEYFKLYYIKRPFHATRPEKEFPLPRILATSADRKDELRSMINRAISTDEQELGSFTKPMLGEEIEATVKRLNIILAAGSKALVSVDSEVMKKKPGMIKELIRIRSKYFHMDTTVKAQLEEKARKEFNEMYPEQTSDARLEELRTCPIYQLSAKVLDDERYKTYKKSDATT